MTKRSTPRLPDGIETGSTEEQLLELLEKRYPGLEPRAYFDSGSTARVYHVRMPLGSQLSVKVDRIIKIFRHDGDFADHLKLDDIFQNEIETLASISNSNLIGIFAADFLQVEDSPVPYYVMEYLPGAADLDDWVAANLSSVDSDQVLDLLMQAAQGIQALHEKGVIHCDIKFGNLLVGSETRLKVADLGFAKLATGGKTKTFLYTTFHNFPDIYKRYIQRLPDKRQMFAEIPRDRISADFDLHYFQGVITDLLAVPGVRELFEERDLRMLHSMAKRMNLDQEALLPKYSSMTEVLEDLAKLRRQYLDRAGLQELSTYTGTRTVRIPVSGSIAFPRRVEEVVSHPLYLRLHNALQLGFTYLVFPGARHTRFEHSLGVFANTSRYINSLLSDDYQPFFRQLIDEEKISTTLLAGLIHDVGQHSFAHGLEDVSLVEHHEFVAESFITGSGLERYLPLSFIERSGPLQDVISRHWPEVDIQRLVWMITGKRASGMAIDAGWAIMKEILDGPIDADKTDYLLRDALHAGVEYARSIDITRFMNSLTASVVERGAQSKGVLGITWKGAQSAENIILARTQMFWVLYWHHAIRSAHAMFAHASAAYVGGDQAVRKDFNHALYSNTIGEMLSLLEHSTNSRAQYLGRLLRERRLFKRGITLDFVDSGTLYSDLLERKEEAERPRDQSKKPDPLLKGISENLAEAMNAELASQKSKERVTPDDVIVDIPKAAKDKLGRIYVVEKNAETARPYVSKGLAGVQADWQNRVRTIRIFLDPRIEKGDREIVRKAGFRILENL